MPICGAGRSIVFHRKGPTTVPLEMVPRYIHVFSRSRVACFLWCRLQNGDRRTTVYQVTGREESYRLGGQARYDAVTDSLLRFPTPFVDPLEGSNVPRAGQGVPCSTKSRRRICRGTNKPAPYSASCQCRLFRYIS